jgi:hypothetical protein
MIILLRGRKSVFKTYYKTIGTSKSSTEDKVLTLRISACNERGKIYKLKINLKKII